jgi:hypothetical protein
MTSEGLERAVPLITRLIDHELKETSAVICLFGGIKEHPITRLALCFHKVHKVKIL